MLLRIIYICMLLFLGEASNDIANPLPRPQLAPCPLESSCGKSNESSTICRLDEQANCIRKYASKCHLDIAACHEGRKTYDDYSDIYCQMETYICEETSEYERWTIFFSHEKD